MIANITAVGNLGKDAELRSSAKGESIATFTMATSHGYGERKGSTWWRVTVFGRSAEFAAKLRKGDRVYVAGEAYEETWQGRDGERKTLSIDAREVKALSPKSERAPGGAPSHDDDDSRIPF